MALMGRDREERQEAGRRGPAMRMRAVLDAFLFQRNRHPPKASAMRVAAPESASNETSGAAATSGVGSAAWNGLSFCSPHVPAGCAPAQPAEA